MTSRDDDEKRSGEPDPQTGGTDLGADWLMSQLDDTGAYSTIDDETAPPATRDEGGRRSMRRRLRRRQENADAAGADASAGTAAGTEAAADSPSAEATDDGAPTQAFDVMADRAVTNPKPEVPAKPQNDGVFAWGLSPNDEIDPLIAARDESAATSASGEDADAGAADREGSDAPDDDATKPFDPFADHEPLSPEQAAVATAFTSPGAYDRLYDEATMSALDNAAHEDDETDEPQDETVPAPRSAAQVSAQEPVGSANLIDDAPEPEDTSAVDAASVDETESLEEAEPADDPVPPESTGEQEAPDLGILDLFGGGAHKQAAPRAEPQTPEPASLARSGEPTSGESESDTSARLRALFDSTAAHPVAEQATSAASAAQRATDVPARTARSGRAGGSGGAGGSGRGGTSGGGAGGGRPRTTRPVVLVGFAVVAVLVLGGLFWVGTLIPGMVSASQPEPTQTQTSTPTPTIPAEGTLPAGTYSWEMLRGGECLSGYESPWAEEFTVVDCAGEHDAQLVAVGTMSDDENAEFPGEDELASQIYLKCSDPSVLDLAKAGEYGDVQVQGSYPVTEEQWEDGQRNFYCFVNRSSGDPLTGSLVPAE